MKISEVIKKLQEIQKEHGDLQVKICRDENDVSIDCMDFIVDKHILYIDNYGI